MAATRSPPTSKQVASGPTPPSSAEQCKAGQGASQLWPQRTYACCCRWQTACNKAIRRPWCRADRKAQEHPFPAFVWPPLALSALPARLCRVRPWLRWRRRCFPRRPLAAAPWPSRAQVMMVDGEPMADRRLQYLYLDRYLLRPILPCNLHPKTSMAAHASPFNGYRMPQPCVAVIHPFSIALNHSRRLRRPTTRSPQPPVLVDTWQHGVPLLLVFVAKLLAVPALLLLRPGAHLCCRHQNEHDDTETPIYETNANP